MARSGSGAMPPQVPAQPHQRYAMVTRRRGQRMRLYVRGTILGFMRSISNQHESDDAGADPGGEHQIATKLV